MTKANISEYEELEQRLIEKDAQFREYFTTTGVIGDQKIKDPKKRESQQKKRRRLYQNTVMPSRVWKKKWEIMEMPSQISFLISRDIIIRSLSWSLRRRRTMQCTLQESMM